MNNTVPEIYEYEAVRARVLSAGRHMVQMARFAQLMAGRKSDHSNCTRNARRENIGAQGQQHHQTPHSPRLPECKQFFREKHAGARWV